MKVVVNFILAVTVLLLGLGLAAPMTWRSSASPLNITLPAPTVRGAEVVLAPSELENGEVRGRTLSDGPMAVGAVESETFTSAVLESSIRFSHLGLRYSGDVPVAGTVEWEARGSRDGKTWTQWYPFEEDDDLPFSVDGQRATRVFGLREDTVDELFLFAQVRARLSRSASGEAPSISSVSIAFIDPTLGPTTAEAARAISFSELGTTPLAIAKPAVISRTSWGSPDGQSSRWTPEYKTVTHAIVHHTVTSSQAIDWAAEIRAIWYYHAITLGWGDIGYNYLVDPNGYIYEGRAGGDDVIAGHALQYNAGSLGTAYLGDYASTYPSTSAQNSMANLLSWKADQRGINPMDSSKYLVDKYLPTIMGHRDAINTTCPGNSAYSTFPQLRSAVWNRIVSQPASAQIVSAVFEPTTVGSGSLLKITATVRNSGSVTIQSQGPSPGFVYGEGDQFSSFESEKFARFRLGVDVDSRTQSVDHPYRWGLGRDLAPGETTTVIGYVRLSSPKTAAYWAGVVREGVSWSDDGVARTAVRVVSDDATPPSSSVSALARFASTRSFTVRWSGTDGAGGSGVSYYDVEYREGQSGTWQAWLRGTTSTQASFTGTEGQTYYFRSWAVDNNGNDERSRTAKPDGDTFTTIDTIPPVVTLSVPSSTSRSWVVFSWSVTDNLAGVAAGFDVDYGTDGTDGTDGVNWTPWVQSAPGPSALFTAGSPGQRYYFRVKARDNAGNQGMATGGPVQLGYDSSGLSKSWLPLMTKGAQGR